jgi:glycosyltransferase involved in cell wall biosynthesis
MKHGKTAVYTILKNEKKYIEKWLYYADPFDYKVLLDTGSTDGSWELLQECAAKDPKLIIEQKTFNPWHFSNARNYNMTMIPEEVVWCLSPDLDEYYSINTHDMMEVIIDAVPTVTNIATTRLDIYSPTVFVGPPNHIASNKIHRKADYHWVQPIYEHLRWKNDGYENEVYAEEIFLIHDQDFKKKERSELYIKMLREEYATNPTNTWCLWFLIYHFYKSKNMEEYIPAVCDYLRYHTKKEDKNYTDLLKDITNIYLYERSVTDEQKKMIFDVIKGNLV